jgi:putative ABC transport system permease protein
MSFSHEITPPKWPLRLLRFFIKKEFLEEIEGDMEELFQDNLVRFTIRKAKRKYAWDMLTLLRPSLVKNLKSLENINQLPMFKNYFKVSLRGLMKSPLNSFINIFGLSLSIGVSIYVYAFARYTYSTDQFHEHKNEVYLATFFAERDGTAQQYGTAPRPLAEMLKQDFPQISKVCRVEDRSVIVKYEDRVFHERIRYADAEFLEMLTFPLKWGTSGSLSDLNSIILSEEMSIKYFGDENPIGQNILVKFDQERSKAFRITGVAKEFPASHTIEFNFLINFENLKIADPAYDYHDWKSFVNATMIQVENPTALSAINKKMEKYRTLQNKASDTDWAISSFAFEPLATLHERSEFIKDDISRSSGNNYKSVIYLTVVGVFMLLLACLNYINIGIVSAAKRLKEIGVRKSFGATRTVVAIQFLSENIIITAFAMIFGMILAVTVFIPGFESLWDFNMGFKFTDKTLWIYLPIILLVTSIASGIYPSLYISRFQVVGILKGAVKFGTKNPVTKLFLGLQLILACCFITSAVMFTQNSNYLGKRSWGYEKDEAMYATVPDYAAFEKLNALMSQNPNVVSISGSANHLGKSHTTAVLHFPDHQVEVDQLAVDAKYFETMGLQLSEGRFFEDHEGSDRHAVIVNDLLVQNSVWQDPIGQTFKIDSVEYEVVGVLKEFHSYSFFRKVRPTIFRVADKKDFRYLSMKVRKGSENKTYKDLEAKWAGLFPEIPFEGGQQEDVWGFYYSELAIHSLVWEVFAFIAVSLAALGLYGLMTLNVAGRVREFSIRKVLGAGMKNLTFNITRQYAVLFVVALLIGAPVSYLLTSSLLHSAYKYHMPFDYSGTIIAVVILITVLLITLATQVRKVVTSNPVDGLKIE